MTRKKRKALRAAREERTRKWVEALYAALPEGWTICFWSRGVRKPKTDPDEETKQDGICEWTTKRIYCPLPTSVRAFWVCAHELGHAILHFKRAIRVKHKDLILSWGHRNRKNWFIAPKLRYEDEYEAERFAEWFLQNNDVRISAEARELAENYVLTCIAKHILEDNIHGYDPVIVAWCHMMQRSND